MTSRVPLLTALVLALAPALTRAEPPARDSLFDPARHMLVSEVHPGMKGYGLTVFKGTKIEKFDVEVLSVLKNFNPKTDVVLITCKGDFLKHTGSIAGMSGSPIFLLDDHGKYRMIGAFAYGWPLTKDPVAGVQPIQYMLKLPVGKNMEISSGEGSADRDQGETAHPKGRSGFSWSLLDAGLIPFYSPRPQPRIPETRGLSAQSRLGGDVPQLQPLATPLMAGGLSPQLIKQVAPLFARYGLTVLEAGGGAAPADAAPVKMEPGAALAVPLLTGDVDMTAIGTVTETIGNRVFGFGHPFNNEGIVRLPMGSGAIQGVIANLQTSFKLGSLLKTQGELTTDESVGVAGEVGGVAPMVPIEFHVSYADGAPPRVYHFRSVLHPKFTPLLAGVALSAAMTGPSELPQYNTVNYDLKLQFANGRGIDIANEAVNTNAQELASEIGLPLMAASENPFERVPIAKITGTIHVSNDALQAQILEVNLPRSRYRAGETIKAFVTYKPFRDEERIMPVEMELPRDLPQGTYQLIVSDASRYFQDMQAAEPFRFTADDIQDVFGVLKDVAAIRQNAIYLRLLRRPDGVAVGRVALAELPTSRRQILLGAGRSNITPYVSSNVKTIPTEMVMAGSAEFAITIDPTAKVEVAGPKPAKAAPASALPAASKKSAAPKPAAAEPAAPEPAPSNS